MKVTNLTPINLNEEQKQEFYKVYRILTTEFMELQKHHTHLNKMRTMARSDMSSLQKVIDLCNGTDDSELHDFSKLLGKNVADTEQYLEKSKTSLDEFEIRMERSSKFIQALKDGVHVVDDEGNVEVGDNILFLIDYLHSLGHILEPEEKEELQKQQGVS